MIGDARIRPPRRYAWLALALVIPSLGLAGIAGWALRADRRAAEGEARDRARDLARLVMTAVTNRLGPTPDVTKELHWLRLDEQGRLSWPVPGVWPPIPEPLSFPESRAGRELWARAENALFQGAASEAIRLAERLLADPADTESAGSAFDESAGERRAADAEARASSSGPLAPRFRANVELLRAHALRASGQERLAVEAFRTVMDSSNAEQTTETGLSASMAAFSGILELAEDRADRLPAAWRGDPAVGVGEVARIPSTPISEAAIARFRHLLPGLATNAAAHPDLGQLDAPLARRDFTRRAYAAFADRRLKSNAASGSEVEFFMLDRRAWLALRMPELSGDAIDGAAPVGHPTVGDRLWLLRAWSDVLDSARGQLREADAKGLFGLAVSVAGTGFSIDHEEPTGVRTRAEATATSLPRAGLAVAVAIAPVDGVALFAGQRRRERLLGSIVGSGVALSAMAAWMVWRVLVRQHRLGVQKSNFVSSVSHELRSPLASVRLLADNLIEDRIGDPERRSTSLKLIGRECRRLGALVDNVLDLSRIERGTKRMQFEPTDLPALVRETVRLATIGGQERSVGVRVRIGHRAEDWVASVDAVALQQALANLLDNALKHAPRGTEVEVELDAVGESSEWTVSVTDRGPGIPESERTRVFEPFHRLGSELRREQPGIGIGLSIVKHAVEAHGGSVWIEAVLPVGSRFVVRMPSNPRGGT